MKPELSIIIPTLNEEKYLPELLESIKKQSYKDYETIVADNNSKDKTKKIAKKYGAKVIKGGKPAKARNEGAKCAEGNLLLFLDADVILTQGYLKYVVSDFKKRKLGIALSSIRAYSKENIDKFLYMTADSFIKAVQYFKAHGAGCCGIMVKKEIHKKIKGFDESINLGEDTDYISRASDYGRFRVLKKTIHVSPRRFEVEGRAKATLKYIKSTYYDFLKKGKNPKIIYEFDKYSK